MADESENRVLSAKKPLVALEEWYELSTLILSEGFETSKKPESTSDNAQNDLLSKVRRLRIDTYNMCKNNPRSDIRKDEMQLQDVWMKFRTQEKLTEELLVAMHEQADYHKKVIEEYERKLNEKDLIVNDVRARLSQYEKTENSVKSVMSPDTSVHREEKEEKKESPKEEQPEERVACQSMSNNEEIRFDTNWNDLSDKLKLACIQHLDFDDRIHLRSTARAERALTDSQRMIFDKVVFFPENSFLETWKNSKCTKYQLHPNSYQISSQRKMNRLENMLDLLDFILRNCNIKCFECNELEGSDQAILRDIGKRLGAQTIRIKDFESERFFTTTQFFLSRCWGKLQNVRISDRNFPLDGLIHIPSIMTAKCLHLNNEVSSYSQQFVSTVQNFIVNDRPVGSKLLIKCSDDTFFEEMAVLFEKMIITISSDNEFRIRSFNPETQVEFKLDAEKLLEIIIVPSDW